MIAGRSLMVCAIWGLVAVANADELLDAVRDGKVDFVKQELSKDASWVQKRKGSEALRIAATSGHLEICKLLLVHKADVNSFDWGLGDPIIVDAVNHTSIVKLLIENGANLKRRITYVGDKSGVFTIGDEATVLHHAVEAGNFECVKLLITAGLDPNATDNWGQTPLHIAIECVRRRGPFPGHESKEFVKIVEYLLAQDASYELRNQYSKTVLDAAKDLLEFAEAISKSRNADAFDPVNVPVIRQNTSYLESAKKIVELIKKKRAQNWEKYSQVFHERFLESVNRPPK